MELVYDWKGFHSLFYAKKRVAPSDSAMPLYFVLDGKTVVSAFCESEDLSDLVGAPYDEVMRAHGHRDKVVLDRKKVDEWLNDSMNFSHFHEQIQFLREHAKPQLIATDKYRHQTFIKQGHFLLEATQSWWHKVIPSSYGLYIRLDGGKGPSLFLMIQRTKLTSFHIPDLAGLSDERQKNLGDVVKFLSERYLIPVQGFSLTSEEWQQWSESHRPWPLIFNTLKANREKIAPFRWGVVALIGMRAGMGI